MFSNSIKTYLKYGKTKNHENLSKYPSIKKFYVIDNHTTLYCAEQLIVLNNHDKDGNPTTIHRNLNMEKIKDIFEVKKYLKRNQMEKLISFDFYGNFLMLEVEKDSERVLSVYDLDSASKKV